MVFGPYKHDQHTCRNDHHRCKKYQEPPAAYRAHIPVQKQYRKKYIEYQIYISEIISPVFDKFLTGACFKYDRDKEIDNNNDNIEHDRK